VSDPLADREGKLLRRIAALEAARNELMATVEQVVEKLDKAEAELAALKAENEDLIEQVASASNHAGETRP